MMLSDDISKDCCIVSNGVINSFREMFPLHRFPLAVMHKGGSERAKSDPK